MNTGRTVQLRLFGALLLAYAVLAFTYVVTAPLDQLIPSQDLPEFEIDVPLWLLGIANAVLILVIYGLLGIAGYWLARKAQLPGILRTEGGWRGLLASPALFGLGVGIVIVIADNLFALLPDRVELPHLPFPYSVIASATAAIGEEILFRLFLLSLWAVLLSLVFRRFKGTFPVMGIADVLAAVAFAAAHLPAAMLVLGVSSPVELPTSLLLEIIALNSLVGLIAGLHYIRNGLVAAIGVHFWTDMVLHVVAPLIIAW